MDVNGKHRRQILRGLGASALTATALSGAPSRFTAHAADTSNYQALVCVFLFGGLDHNEVLIPYDTASYRRFRTLRSSLIIEQGESRQRERLLPITMQQNSVLQGRQMAMPPELPALKALFDRGDLAIVGNVGPLLEPVTRQRFERSAARLPPRLFSHNDQQSTWQASAPEGAQFGWGGLFADAVLATGANQRQPQFTTIASNEVGPFLTGRQVVPYRVGVKGAARVHLLDDYYDGFAEERAESLAAIRAQLAAQRFSGEHVLEQDLARAFAAAFDTNEAYDRARQAGDPLTTEFPQGPLGQQLHAVAETINVREQLFANKQVFFVGLGGFDTHSAQAENLPRLLEEVDGAMAAFYRAMTELELQEQVTLFTASDFGRTLAVNGDGTDHGWGGHHLVLGGAVKGGEIYGAMPPTELGHDADCGSGRLIPTMAVEQYAAELGRWFGLSQTELTNALPNLSRFDALKRTFL